MKFTQFALSEPLLEAIRAAGYTEATPIQEKAIPAALEGRDVLGIAQTGTGKTGAFVLPMIARLEKGRARARMPRSLIIAPTRELAAQVAENFETLGVNHKLSMALLIGGVSFAEQNRIIDRGADVLIVTPGRLIDHMERGKLMLNAIEVLVIDEADRMLDMGFIPDIEKIIKLLPFTRQTLFFSATMPPVIQKLVDEFLHNPVRIEIARQATTASTIAQKFCYVPQNKPWAKRAALRELINGEKVSNAIIFCNRKRDIGILQRSLVKHGFSASALHGDMDQHSRTKTLEAFKNNEVQLLCASDVAARGLDIPEVSHVFNFDIPHHAEDYVHRIGRTGRAGREGAAFSIVTSADLDDLEDIKKLCKMSELEWTGDSPGSASQENRKDEKSGRKRRRSSGSARSSQSKQGGKTASGGKAGAENEEERKTSPARRRRGGRKKNTEEKNRSKGEGRPAAAKPGGRKRRGKKDVVIGMGDHVPAFMTKPVKP
jgi:superfamily II DNA/RNA helicase